MRAHLYDANVRFIACIVDRDLCHALYPILYGGSHVGNNLHYEGVIKRVKSLLASSHLDGLAQIVAASLWIEAVRPCSPERIAYFFFDHFFVYLSGGNIVIPREGNVKITFVVSQIQINLSSII